MSIFRYLPRTNNYRYCACWVIILPLFSFAAIADHNTRVVSERERAEIATLTDAMAADALTKLQTEQFDSAEQLLRSAVAITEQRLGSEHPEVAISLFRLAGLLARTKRTEDSIDPLQRALAIAEHSTQLGADYTVPILLQLVNNLRRLSQFGDAYELAQRAITLQISTVGPNHPVVAKTMHSQAMLLRDMARNQEARKVFKEALQLLDQEDNAPPEILIPLMLNYASLLQELLEHEEAERVFRRVLKASRQQAKAEPKQLVEALQALAGALENTDHRSEAESLYKESIALSDSARGPAHVETLIAVGKLGRFFRVTGRYAEAEQALRQTIANLELTPDENPLALASNIGQLAELYREIGRMPEAKILFRRSLDMVELNYGPHHPISVTLLNNLAVLLSQSNQFNEAVEIYSKAVEATEAIHGRNSPQYWIANTNRAASLTQTGQYSEAESVLNSAVNYFSNDGPNQALYRAEALHNLAGVFAQTKRYKAAEKAYREVLSIRLGLLDSEDPRIGVSYGGLAGLLAERSNYSEAEPLYRRSIDILSRRFGPGHYSLAAAKTGLALTLRALGKKAESHSILDEAHKASFDAKQPYLSWNVNRQLLLEYKSENPALAIFYGKQAVYVLQNLRTDVAKTSEDALKSFSASVDHIYRELAGLLMDQGRLAEAEHILELLREQELFQFLRSDVDDIFKLTVPIYTNVEAPLAAEVDRIREQATRIAKELGSLELISKSKRIPSQVARIGDLESQRKSIHSQVQALQDRMATEFSSTASAVGFATRDAEQLAGIQPTLGELGNGVALISYLVTNSHLRILVTTADTRTSHRVDISRKKLNRHIERFRSDLQTPVSDPRRIAKLLHELLVAPIQADLDRAGVRTLMVALDGKLRYLPVAALHDGEQWLVEKYPVVNYTAASRPGISRAPPTALRVAGFGVSEASNINGVPFPALKFIPQELDGIVSESPTDRKGVTPGIVAINKEFTLKRLAAALKQKYPVLHIASHFRFQPTEDGAYLVLGGNQSLSIRDFRSDERLRLRDIDMLVLSACETAYGDENSDGKEAESFAALAQQRGARSVLAALWLVADASTSQFMQSLYAIRKRSGSDKSRSLREVQLSFITGGKGKQPNKELPLFRDRDRPYGHPYYWAPFVLFGNWQ